MKKLAPAATKKQNPQEAHQRAQTEKTLAPAVTKQGEKAAPAGANKESRPHQRPPTRKKAHTCGRKTKKKRPTPAVINKASRPHQRPQTGKKLVPSPARNRARGRTNGHKQGNKALPAFTNKTKPAPAVTREKPAPAVANKEQGRTSGRQKGKR